MGMTQFIFEVIQSTLFLCVDCLMKTSYPHQIIKNGFHFNENCKIITGKNEKRKSVPCNYMTNFDGTLYSTLVDMALKQWEIENSHEL